MTEQEEKRCINLASHAIGLDRKKPYKRHGKLYYRPYRNYYVTGASNNEEWNVMVEAGYSEAGEENRHGGRTYRLTREGLDWLGNLLGIHIYDEEE